MEANIVGSKDYDPHLGLGKQSSNYRKNPLDELPYEISLEIFSKLPEIDLGRCKLVSNQWRELANDKNLKLPDNAFGAKLWYEYFGIKVDEPPLPRDIQEILKSQCLFSEERKKIKDTHVLVLVPGSINGKDPLSLEAFGKLVESRLPKLGQNGYRYLWDKAKESGGDGKSHWVLMTKEVFSESRNKRFAEQIKQIQDKGMGEYQVPSALDAVVCAISEYARSDGNTRLLNDNPFTYTRCKENIESYQVVVGGFAPAGLCVRNFPDFACDYIGVAALRKFF